MRALGKNVIVEKIENETKSSVGIIYTDHSKVTLARVVALGEEVTTLNIDDQVVINWNSAIPIKLNSDTQFIVNIEQVYAII